MNVDEFLGCETLPVTVYPSTFPRIIVLIRFYRLYPSEQKLNGRAGIVRDGEPSE
jgi:hypothetical protein